ncbi:Beta-Ala-His dipeptidase [Actinoplanes sp. SE50]|uniref:dipeptidase n=1 Tax=unclassified Actinoplanes TaxID=2626549 RepID=UPI00023ED08F|nr:MULTISPECIES: dipeptidase [unclassified Actinoplanes]AEV84913.1 Beta-Ala-His dipeptidase [Actinoplanes sp. SE50/110]ATO83304.1 Beta-Ala-His dipeptidase [Actinoplanes sp. SE50]SLM00711.1 beta-Ala-His dipeptidase [Actinoplanes sp. SE50/110]
MDLRAHINELMPRARADLADLVAIRSVADPRQFPPAECERAADWVARHFAQVGFTDLTLHRTSDGSKAVYGQRRGTEPDAPTVLLYAHYDVQPPLDEKAWWTPPFQLTPVGGRWYGRGAADCKGNIVMHLTALRALGDDVPVNLKLIVEGSEEQGTGGLEDFVERHPDLLRADAILVCDTGNAAVGVPAATITLRGLVNVVVTVTALGGELHSGMFGGAAPDALAALIRMLATLRDPAGNTTITGLENEQTWLGAPYPAARFRADAGLIDEARLLGDGSVSDMLWARPAVTVLGVDCPPVVGSAAAIQPRARARLNLRVPPGTDPVKAQDALIAHLHAAAPWGVRVEVAKEALGQPFEARTGGPAYRALSTAMREAYGREMTTLGQGGSIPLCNVFAGAYPDAEIMLIGVEEPLARIHAPNESVAPGEIGDLALAEALFLQRYRK